MANDKPKSELNIVLGGVAITFLILGGIGACIKSEERVSCSERSLLNRCPSPGSSGGYDNRGKDGSGVFGREYQ